MLTPREIAAIAAHALEEKKAKDVKVLKTDLFIFLHLSSL